MTLLPEGHHATPQPPGLNRVAAVVGGQEITYAHFERDIQRCARWLDLHGGADVRLVAVCIRHPYWHWVANLALMRRAVASVSLMPGQLKTPLPVDLCLADGPLDAAWPVLQFDNAALDAAGSPVQASAPDTGRGASGAAAESTLLQWSLHPQAQRWVLTSGTTGRPKVVAITAADLQVRTHAALQSFSTITADTRMLSLLDVDTLGGLVLPLLAWLRGGTVLMGLPSPSGRGQAQVPYFTSNFLMASPAHVNALLQQTAQVWPGREQRQVHVAGARLHPRVRDEALRKMGCQVFSHYGSTEAGLVASCNALRMDQTPGLAGKVHAGVQVQVVDALGAPLPHGQQGVVRLQRPGMAQGYQGEAHSPQFRDGWFYPGDLGTLSTDGWLTVTGREDDLINLGGLKLSAVDLETQWLHHPGVRDIAMVALGLGPQQRLVVAAVLDDGCNHTALGEHIASTLPHGARFVIVRRAALPRNAMGKLERQTIAQQMAQALP